MNKGLIYHVDLDAHNCYPILIDNIIEDIKNKNEEHKIFIENRNQKRSPKFLIQFFIFIFFLLKNDNFIRIKFIYNI